MEVGKALIDVGCCGKFGIGEIAVDVFQNQCVGIDEDAAVVFRQLPEPQLAEIIERRVEVWLAAFGKRGGMMDISAPMAFVEGARQWQEIGGDEAAAEIGKRDEPIGFDATGVKDDDIGAGARQAYGASKRGRSHGVVGVRHERDERIRAIRRRPEAAMPSETRPDCVMKPISASALPDRD